jgi:hypothetical protein
LLPVCTPTLVSKVSVATALVTCIRVCLLCCFVRSTTALVTFICVMFCFRLGRVLFWRKYNDKYATLSSHTPQWRK